MDDNKQGFTGVWIPEYIFNNDEISFTEKFVWAYIASFSGSRLKCCIQSNATIADRLGMSERTVSSAIQKLKELGFVFVFFKNNNHAKRQIFSVDEKPEKTKFRQKNEVSKNCEPSEGVSKNCVEVSKNCEPTNRGEVSKNCEHRINKNKERINTADLAQADETPAKPADDSWVDEVSARVEKTEAPTGYIVVDPNEEYTAEDLYGKKGDDKTAKAIADIKNSDWYRRSKAS